MVYPDLLARRSGFARSVTGGDDQSRYVVTSFNDLLDLATQGNAYISFPRGFRADVHLDEYLRLGSHLTIDGRGAHVRIVGNTVRIDNQTNVILCNIGLGESPAGDALTIRNAADGDIKVWLTHCTLSRSYDGLLDVIWCRENNIALTVDHCLFSNHNKAMLVGTNRASHEKGKYFVTMHHNRFIHCTQRQPLMRRGFLHYYNNLVELYGGKSLEGGGLRAGVDSYVLAENNVAIPHDIGSHHYSTGVVVAPQRKWAGPSKSGQGAIKIVGTMLSGSGTTYATEEENRPEQISGVTYPYSVEPSEVALQRCLSFSGQF